ncbi:unnamed protein product [Musa textilis]
MYPNRMKGVGEEDRTMERRLGAFLRQRSRTWTLAEVGIGSCRSMGFIFRWSRLILHGAKDKGSFEAHAPYLDEAFGGDSKATQFAEAKLVSIGLDTGQEDAAADTLEEYAIVLLFKLP